jgi:hypothetical protein
VGEVASPAEEWLAEMLFYSLFPDSGGFDSASAGLAAVAGEPVLEEMRQVIDIAFDAAHRSTTALGELIPDLAGVPLAVHARYSREEILAGLGVASRRKPSTFREGVVWCEGLNTDAFFVTLKKTDTDYSPTTMYRDFALSPELFHWESQSTTSEASKTGQRYIHHREHGSHILLFVREAKQYALGTAPYVFSGRPTTCLTRVRGRWRSPGGCGGRCRRRCLWRRGRRWRERGVGRLGRGVGTTTFAVTPPLRQVIRSPNTGLVGTPQIATGVSAIGVSLIDVC